MNKQERAIREKRTNEAIKKDYMGASGKLGMIAKFLGHPIVQEGTGMMDVTFLDDPYDDEEDEMPVTENMDVLEIGHEFNGLSSGLHLEIKYMYTNHEIVVQYKGYTVYREVSGDLLAFAPFPEWESLIDKLCLKVKARKKKVEESLEPAIEELVQVKKQSWLQKMRMRWGI